MALYDNVTRIRNSLEAARVITTGQTTLTDANQKRLHSGSIIYKRLFLALSPANPIGDPIYVGLTGVTPSTGFPVPDIGELVMMNIDINTLYVIGTATDIVCWRGEV
jgi:DNA-binding beta-propeller fold protein YncE